jgi:iron complex outermembrane receptor protein
MRTPFAAIPGTAPTPSQYLEADATLRWRSAVEIAIAQNPSLAFLRTLPPPTKASVSSNLAVLNPTTRVFQRVAASQVRDIEGLRPSLNNTVELGYKGLAGDRLRLALDVWHDARRNFVGPSLVETPNVFLDSASTAQYLGQFVPPANAQAIAGGLARIPVGTISPDHPLTNSPGPDIIVTYRNYGKLNVWGSDAAAELMVTNRFSFLGSYSWVNKDLFPRSEVGGLSDVTLNAPASKATLAGRYRDDLREWGWELRGRYVAGFPVQSGVYNGEVKNYTLLDANMDYRLPFSTNVYLTVTAQNLLDHRHREFVGVPELGRFVMTQMRFTF